MGIKFEGFLRMCLKRKFKSELTHRHRQKCILNQFAVSLDATNDSENDCSLSDIVASDFDTFEEVIKKQEKEQFHDKVQEYHILMAMERLLLMATNQETSPNDNGVLSQPELDELIKNLFVPESITIDNLSEKNDVDEMNLYFSMKKRIYEETLVPELVENERKKREHKGLVVEKLFKLLKWQFIATYAFTFIMIAIIAGSTKLSIDTTVLESMFSFMKFYITSILAELVAILFL